MKRLMFVIDLDRCMGCMGCLVGCKQENRTELGTWRNSVCTVGPFGTYPRVGLYYLPVMCQHCENPFCAAVCPTDACAVDVETGTVQIAQERCIGCKSCMKACPYGLIGFNSGMRIADKCSACLRSLAEEELPACARNCAGSAIRFGDRNDPDSEVARLLAETEPQYVYSLNDEGNRPSTRYILRSLPWQETDPRRCEGWKGARNEQV